MSRLILILCLMIAVGLTGAWALTRPQQVDAARLAGLQADVDRGRAVYLAAGCGSCHAAPGATGEARQVLAGGQRFPSAFGTFVAPNVSPSDQGIAGWTALDLANALIKGTGRAGQHLYPALPYGSYARMAPQDVVDLHAFLMTLPADPTPSQPHDLGFPFTLRAALGGWKLLFLSDDWVLTGDLTAQEERGRYLVEALGHCAECHTPRNALGGLDRGRWMAGGPDPSGQGTIPNITPARLIWSVEEIAAYLETGFTPDYDSVGGHMAHVVANYAELPAEDRLAVAAYLKRVPPVE